MLETANDQEHLLLIQTLDTTCLSDGFQVSLMVLVSRRLQIESIVPIHYLQKTLEIIGRLCIHLVLKRLAFVVVEQTEVVGAPGDYDWLLCLESLLG